MRKEVGVCVATVFDFTIVVEVLPTAAQVLPQGWAPRSITVDSPLPIFRGRIAETGLSIDTTPGER